MKHNHRKRKPRKVFSFVVDGETEIWYLQMLKKNENLPRIDIKPELPRKTKLSDQISHIKKLSKFYSKVFWIIDVDEVIHNTKSSKKQNPSKVLQEAIIEFTDKYRNVIIIKNNPCLEFWLLLHFTETGRFFEKCDDAKKELKKHLKDYEKSQKFYKKQNDDIYKKLKPNLSKAINHSKKLNSDKIDLNSPISEMFKIFEELNIN